MIILASCMGAAACNNDGTEKNVASVDCTMFANSPCIEQLAAANRAFDECWKHKGTCPGSASGCGQVRGNLCVWPDGDKLVGYTSTDRSLVLSDGRVCQTLKYVSASEYVLIVGEDSFRYLIQGTLPDGTLTIECKDGTKAGPYSFANLAACSANESGERATGSDSVGQEQYCCSETQPPSCPQPIQLRSPVAQEPHGAPERGEKPGPDRQPEGDSLLRTILRSLR